MGDVEYFLDECTGSDYGDVPGKLKPAILQACLITGRLELNLDMLQHSLLRGDSPFQHMGLDKSRDLLGSDDRGLPSDVNCDDQPDSHLRQNEMRPNVLKSLTLQPRGQTELLEARNC